MDQLLQLNSCPNHQRNPSLHLYAISQSFFVCLKAVSRNQAYQKFLNQDEIL